MAEVKRNVTYAHTEPEVVTKPDGRYLIYYSWPGLGEDEPIDLDEPGKVPADQSRGPDQQPWSPQAGPADE